MKNFEDMSEWKPKKLRTLRNNLNNRLSSFKTSAENAKELQSSNVLHGLDEAKCKELLKEVTTLLKNLK